MPAPVRPTEGRCEAFALGVFAAFFGLIVGAAYTLIDRRPVPPDGLEADYRDPAA